MPFLFTVSEFAGWNLDWAPPIMTTDYINRKILEQANFDKNRPQVFGVRYVGGQSTVPARKVFACVFL